MPLPPLAAPERRLARFAAASTWACALGGISFALAPGLTLRVLSLGGAAAASTGIRLFGAVAGAALFSVALSCRRVSFQPREERKAFHPLLAFLFSGVLFTAVALVRARGPFVPAGELLPIEVALAVLAALFTVAGWVFVTGAPGVNVGPVLTTGPLDKAPSGRIALGVKPAAAAAASPSAAPTDSGATTPAATSAVSPALNPVDAEVKAPAGSAG